MTFSYLLYLFILSIFIFSFSVAVKPFVRKPAFEVVEELDATNRPKQKVALLCGPPGLGKTTLAHVLARHAG